MQADMFPGHELATPVPDRRAFASSIETKKRSRKEMPFEVSYVPPTPMKSPSSSRSAERTSIFSFSLNDPSPTSSRSGSSPSRNPQFERDFKNIGIIGQGSYAVVYKAICYADGKAYAVKHFRRHSSECMKEYHDCRKLPPQAFEFCVQSFAAWEEDNGSFIRMELCDRGTLKHYDMVEDQLSEDTIWRFAADLVQGLSYIHESKMIHLDIKPSNLMLTSTGQLKIADFGIATEMVGSQAKEIEQPGESAYMAPELIDHNVGPITPAADMFSLGVVLLELAADIKIPFTGEDYDRMRHELIQVPESSGRSVELRSLVASLLRRNPLDRPTAAQLCSHPVITRYVELNKRGPREMKFPPQPTPARPPSMKSSTASMARRPPLSLTSPKRLNLEFLTKESHDSEASESKFSAPSILPTVGISVHLDGISDVTPMEISAGRNLLLDLDERSTQPAPEPLGRRNLLLDLDAEEDNSPPERIAVKPIN